MKEVKICSTKEELISQLPSFLTKKEVLEKGDEDHPEYSPDTTENFQKIFDFFQKERCDRIGKSLATFEKGHLIRRYIKKFDNDMRSSDEDSYLKASSDIDKRFNEKYKDKIKDLEEYCKIYYKSRLLHEMLLDQFMPKCERKVVVSGGKGNENGSHICLASYYCKELDVKDCYYEYTLPDFDFKKTVQHINQTFLNDVIYDSSNNKEIIDENSGIVCNLKNKDNSKNKMNMFYNNYSNLNLELEVLFNNDKVDFDLKFTSNDLFTNDINKYWEKDETKLSGDLSNEDLKISIQKILNSYSSDSVTSNGDDYKIKVESDDDWISEDEDETEIIEINNEKNIQTITNDVDKEKYKENDKEIKSQSHFINIMPVKIEKPSQGFHTQIIKSEYLMAHTISRQVTEEYFEKIDKQFFAPYKFELDLFQKQACVSIANNENVFVSAHTSAGKTLIAEFACRFHTHACQKVFYTSPIKALSNQKYNDFRGIFNDVGLVTGDTQINKEAEIIIVTTEILQSMLYNDSQMLNDLACVIFDEVHYINNAQRGHVWEEVLIMLPKEVKVVMLSATVPNYIEFSDWVGRVLNDKVVCITTLYRPVQLKHQVYVEAHNKQEKNFITIMVGDNKNLNYTGYAKMNNELNDKGSDEKGNNSTKKGPPIKSQYQNKSKQVANRVISNLYQANGPNSLGSYDGTHRNLYSTLIRYLHFPPNGEKKTPMVIFVFSRKQCDNYVAMLHNVDLTTSEEKFHITTIFKNAKSFLDEKNLDLPQITFVEESCQRGIAMHHSGMLPFLKEIVEIAFSRGYVKVLFATETFAMGINMPTKTVIFDDIKKFDNSNKRLLTPTEYTQMAGRAGRRGLDKAGHVIILAKNKKLPDIEDLRKIMTGKSVTLSSKFKITNEMVLNVFQRECRSIRDFITNSFAESDTLRFVENIDDQIKELNGMLEEIRNDRCAPCDKDENYSTRCLVQNFATLIKARQDYNRLVLEISPLQQIGIGRVIVVDVPEYQLNHILGIVVGRSNDDVNLIVITHEDEGYDRKKEFNIGDIRLEKDNLSLHTLLMSAYYNGAEYINEKYCILKKNELRYMSNVPIKNIVSLLKLQFKANDVRELMDSINLKSKNKNASSQRNIDNVKLKLQQLSEKLTKTNFDPSLILKPVSIKNSDYSYYLDIINNCKYELMNKKYPCFECSEGWKHYENAVKEYFINDRLQMINNKMNVETLEVYEEYINKVKALKKLEFLENASRHEEDNEANTIISFKGRSACRMGSYQVLITEIIYRGLIKNKSPEYIAAMIAIIASEGDREFNENKECDENLERAPIEELEEIQSVFKMVHDHINEAFIYYQTPNNDLIETYSPSMMEVAYLWMKGVSLSDIMKIHTIPEGNIVRNLRKIWDLFNGMKKVLEHMGSKDEATKLDEMSKQMARGIVFSASLYTTGGEDDKKKQKEIRTKLPKLLVPKL
uniref:Helicase ATP-binding domain-containing protein n=1 Tax=Strongyloides stercoralis TaxID=6248 RepID=A0AAF5D1Z4_STRER